MFQCPLDSVPKRGYASHDRWKNEDILDMRFSGPVSLCILAGALVGCVTTRTEVDDGVRLRYAAATVFDRSIAFPSSGEYDWFYELDPATPADDPEAVLRDAVGAELSRRGFELRPEGDLAFYVAPRVILETRKTDEQLNAEYREPESPDRWLPGHDGNRRYDPGTIVVDLVCAQDHCPRWRGAVTVGFEPDIGEEELRRRIEGGVRALFLSFPPKTVRGSPDSAADNAKG